MKLFEDFEAIKFPEENMLFVIHNGYLYYIYDLKSNRWQKYRNAGNDKITISNYKEITKKEIENALQGNFPHSEVDFMRLCEPVQLHRRDMLALLEEDYSSYMSDSAIYDAVYQLLWKAEIHHKAFSNVKEIFDTAATLQHSDSQVFESIEKLCFSMMGRDILKKEIEIVDGHDSRSYFYIMPVRVIDYSDTNNFNNVAELKNLEISIEQDDFEQYLTPFLLKYYDDALEENRKRSDANGFEWYLTHNFFTFTSITDMLKDMDDTMEALSAGRENEFTAKLREKRGTATWKLYSNGLSREQIEEYNANRPTKDDTEAELIIDFYRRFIFRMEYMMRVGAEKGCHLVSVSGP